MPLLATLAHSLGVMVRLEGLLPRRRRCSGYAAGEKVLSLALLQAAGGTALDDIDRLRGDEGLSRLLGRRVPSAETLGRLLRSAGGSMLRGLTRGNHALVGSILRRRPLRTLTIDVDATLIESRKRQARRTYKGFRGYDPLLAHIAQLGVVLTGVFREGNASPPSHAHAFLGRCLRLMRGRAKTIRLRSDSAWYEARVLDRCHEEGVEFAITADQDGAVQDLIERIPEGAWKALPSRFGEECAWAAAIHTLNRSRHADRLIVLRRKVRQPDLFDGLWFHHAVITNIESHAGPAILRWHRGRMGSENLLKELKEGFAVRHLPCGELAANAAYFQIGILAHNLVQALKLLTLPRSWERLRIKALRFRLLGVAGLVTRHARSLRLKLPSSYPHFLLFRKARWRSIGLAAE
ncbi:MAG: IS1380 family transposase [Candidatus Eisenbacteria bacterium]